MFRSVFLFLMIMMLTSLALPLPESYGQLSSRDILVTHETAGTGGVGALFKVDPSTGARTIFSDFGDPTQGPTGGDPSGVAVEASGSILVTDEDANVLFRIDPVTGVRTILSDFSDGTQGPTGVDLTDVAVEASGSILVVDEDDGTGGLGALFRVDPITGDRTLLSDFGVGANQGENPAGVAVEASGTILVIDEDAGGSGILFRVDPVTGVRTKLSDFGDATQGPIGSSGANDVAVEASGTILVIDEAAGGSGILFRVDPVTGVRTNLSDFGDAGQGPTVVEAAGVAVEFSGTILVTDEKGTGGSGALFRIDPVTGTRTILSDFGVGDEGAEGVAVYDPPAPVGGYLVPSNKLAVLTPYIVLAGLIAVVSTVYVIKRRRD